MTTKIYTKRDSITAILRKRGVDKTKYNDFIKVVDGGFELVETVTKVVERPVKTAVKTNISDLAKTLADNAGKEKPKKEKLKKEKEGTISELIRTMILDNKTNAEIFKACQDKFGKTRFNEEKSHYPAWYRCEMRRRGELPAYADPKSKLPKTTKVVMEK